VSPTAAEEHLEELDRLLDTAGGVVVGIVRQRLDAPHPKYFVGEGKAHEVLELAREKGADLVIFDDELSPAQSKNLEALLKLRVMDRTELILDIFVTRARTTEAQMQVEVAQLEYMLPRLKRLWTHLERTAGGVGIGMRGPGETQLETDRRLISRRIRDLKEKLATVARRRATQRKSRAGEFRGALVGYTNAGKSSILRGLSGSDVFVEDRLFATLDPATRSVELPGGAHALVTDTVGFIRKLPHDLIASFRATLEEATEADVLLHVIDAAFPTWPEQKHVVEGVLSDLGLDDRPIILVFNKVDRLTHSEERSLREQVRAVFPETSILVSAVEPGGLDALRDQLQEEMRASRPEVRLTLPSTDGEALAVVYREGEVLGREEDGEVIRLRARLPKWTLGRLQQRDGVQVSQVV
jgi:GTP-binding protein HflX